MARSVSLNLEIAQLLEGDGEVSHPRSVWSHGGRYFWTFLLSVVAMLVLGLLSAWSLGQRLLHSQHSFCNPTAPITEVATPREIFIRDSYWKSQCMQESHQGHWVPSPNLKFRNWCWAHMKGMAQSLSWKDKDVTPPNWWWVQWHVANMGLAPWPDKETLFVLGHPEICDISENGAPEQAVSKLEARQAQEWLRRNLAVYVVNLDKAITRMNTVAARLAALGIEATRIPGVDLSVPGSLEKAQQDGIVPSKFDLEDAKKLLWDMYGASQPGTFYEVAGIGTVGCAAAHLRAMRVAASASVARSKPLTLILEDDVLLSDDFAVKLRRMIELEVPCDWQAISLKSYNPVGECVSRHLSRVHPDGMEPAESCRKAANWGFQSMLYRSSQLDHIQDLLASAVWDERRPTCLVQDIALASISDKLSFYAVPASQRPGFVTFARDAGWREAINR